MPRRKEFGTAMLVKLDPVMLRALDEAAYEDGITRSGLIRSLVDSYLSQCYGLGYRDSFSEPLTTPHAAPSPAAAEAVPPPASVAPDSNEEKSNG